MARAECFAAFRSASRIAFGVKLARVDAVRVLLLRALAEAEKPTSTKKHA